MGRAVRRKRLGIHSQHMLATHTCSTIGQLVLRLTTQVSPYPIIQHSVLGHAVGFTELLHSASIVAVEHLKAEARAVSAGAPGMGVIPRCQLIPKEQLAVWNTS